MEDRYFSLTILQPWVEKVFLHMGYNLCDAQTATTVLLSADIRGVSSHGIARLSQYFQRWKEGRIQSTCNVSIIKETPSTATIDAANGLGLVVGVKSMQIAIDKAKQVGTGWVVVNNSTHFGIAGYHAMLALPHDMIGIAMTNASAQVAPTNSKERMLGTNPIAVAVPTGNDEPFVLDMATSAASFGKIEIAERKNMVIPEGWVQDMYGEISTMPTTMKKGGSLLPLGSDVNRSSHKGYGLSSVVDILSGVLSGASYGPWIPPFPSHLPIPANTPGKGVGHFFGAMRVDAFREKEDFFLHVNKWISRMRQAMPISPEKLVLVAGDRARLNEKINIEKGICIIHPVLKNLQSIAKEIHIEDILDKSN